MSAGAVHLPVRLDHAKPERSKITVVDWCLGNHCNYACSYCPDRLHDGSLPWADYDTVIAFCDRLIAHYAPRGQTLFFQFTGGEPSVYAPFLDLCRHLKKNACHVGVISNASRTVRWWTDARDCLTQAVLTHHIEFVDLDHFIAVARLLAPSLRTHVNVTMLPNRFEDCLTSAKRIAAKCDDITLSLKPLLINFGPEMYPYTPAQKAAMTASLPIRRTRPLHEIRGEMRVTHHDQSTLLRKSTDFIVTDENHWTGWQCNIGLELLSVNFHGEIFRGICKQGGRLGHITDRHLALPTAPILCTHESCTCLTDIMTTRWRA
jgi:organic radical activating enzyme